MKQLMMVAACLCLFCACTHPNVSVIENAPELYATYTDDIGREVVVKTANKQVLSTAPSITEMIFAIGAQDQLVARTQACDYPPEVQYLPVVQTYPEVDMEQILQIKPDLVFTTTEIFSKDMAGMFDVTGIPLYYEDFDSVADIFRNIRKMGVLLNRTENANFLADSLEQVTQKLFLSTDSLAKYRTLVLISDQPLMVAGGKGFVEEMIRMAGGKNVFSDLPYAYSEVTPEAILKSNPEYIILPTDDQDAYAKLVSLYPILLNTEASVKGRVFAMDPDLVFRPGPRTPYGIARMATILHSTLPIERFFPFVTE